MWWTRSSVVLEKHIDFFRDFRGDTVHPSTLGLIHELGLIDEFLKLRHQKVETLTGQVGAEHLQMADFPPCNNALQIHRPDAAMGLPQLLAQQAKSYKIFDLRMNAEATDLVEEAGLIVGLRATTPDGRLTIRAQLDTSKNRF
jgi:2-polyprenyl-6-methoxyphenol hydroxylase-like FAD-dependent oxidoreductase